MNISSRHKIFSIGNKDEIKEILANGKKISTRLGPVFLYNENTNNELRAGILLKKDAGIASIRNYIKRIFRECIRNRYREIKNYNRIILIYTVKRSLNYNEFCNEFCKLYQYI
jgi:ribonuclease P protein component